MQIKRLRKKLNLTQVEFGKIINKSHATIRKYESGEIEVPSNIDELLKLKYPEHFEKKKSSVKILEKLSIPTKDIALRLGLGLRTCQNYINGSQKIPTPIEKLIDYEFGKIVIQNNLLHDEKENYVLGKTLEVERLEQRNAELQKINGLQARNIELLEEQIQLYKDRLKNYEGKSTA
ncbi:helix-turn-helix domain-containing protein [Mesonia sp. K4-1]|jgi:transcriptional regulator with XRE-family HTH domain|uniref:helix-turn-helix domain-containing protein n=1 Tax=Mesonia sp. K4-1 TaxID=2602760 RepID=UPI0011CC62C1|nr:helix-turn-helix domain-containing protein [Mesonia sp. K4-1]TXK71964.1 helix-turn-helix domain-containing protein [Mesonia sp. K4-1]